MPDFHLVGMQQAQAKQVEALNEISPYYTREEIAGAFKNRPEKLEKIAEQSRFTMGVGRLSTLTTTVAAPMALYNAFDAARQKDAGQLDPALLTAAVVSAAFLRVAAGKIGHLKKQVGWAVEKNKGTDNIGLCP